MLNINFIFGLRISKIELILGIIKSTLTSLENIYNYGTGEKFFFRNE